MKKAHYLFLFILCSLFHQNLNGQDVKLQLINTDTCTNNHLYLIPYCSSCYNIFRDSQAVDEVANLNLLLFDSLMLMAERNEGNQHKFTAFKKERNKGIIYLPDTGTYYISLFPNYLRENYPNYDYKIYVSQRGLTIDSIEVRERISASINMGSDTYTCCNLPCEGYQEEYYLNGQLSIRGTFKNGYPIDTLEKFNYKGYLNYRKIDTDLSDSVHINKIERFDLLGNSVETIEDRYALHDRTLNKISKVSIKDSMGIRKSYKRLQLEENIVFTPEEIRYDQEGNITWYQKENILKIYKDGYLTKQYEWHISDSLMYKNFKSVKITNKDKNQTQDFNPPPYIMDSIYYIIQYKEFNKDRQLIKEGLLKANFNYYSIHNHFHWGTNYSNVQLHFSPFNFFLETVTWIYYLKKYDKNGLLIKKLKNKDYEFFEGF